uniref:Uncharacterized protein LOC113796468 isoform X2 n=1 Tax=Dermatophagoides pteronyssinus TaxID=6956 RepID=A0A6P6YCZ1_DERPT|nr:uncharacterized protein LOC113796468 isoform X2 [Dermatophagoides pteronyssinus]
MDSEVVNINNNNNNNQTGSNCGSNNVGGSNGFGSLQFNSFIKYPEVKLDRVIGLTVSNNASLDCDFYSGTVVYTSGCVLVLYNQRKNKQFHIINSLKKPITCCKFSKDGKYIVTGECGHQPQCRIWEISTGEQVACLSGHKYGINCVAFSPDGKYVVSIGSQHDMMVNVWDWRQNHIVASNKISVKIKSISFAENGQYFVTVGNRHVKFWYLDYHNDTTNANNQNKLKNKFESLPLMGRNAILGDQRNNYFCDVACDRRGSSGGNGSESTYAITKSGLLCEFNNRRLLNKWVELRTESANCITLSQNLICVGCSQGIIRCFRPQTLEFVTSLPRPHQLGIDIAKNFQSSRNESAKTMLMIKSMPKYPDTIAIVLDDLNKIVTAIYSDRSIYFWSFNDMKRIGKLNSFLYHSSCIWDIDVYPYNNSKNNRPLLPPGTFLTCSSDDTIRLWNIELDMKSTVASSANYIYKKNFFSPELMKILYMDPDLMYLCDQDLVPPPSTTKSTTTTTTNSTNGNTDQYDSKNGIRAIKFSNDGKHLASGDRCGNIRIFDLEMQKDLFKIEAHDGEVLCLEYSNEQQCGRALLVSASRDRFIHIYDVHRQYSCIQNIDDHSSSITSVKFVCCKQPNSLNLKLISCGADKSLIFRRQTDPDSDFRLEHQVAGKCTFFDMAVDQKKNHIVTASQDRLIRTYDVWTGKNLNNFKGSLSEDGALIKIAFDPSNTFLATSCTDKSIYIYDYQSGECLATTSGHSEIVTGLKFSLDGRHLISVSGDGCIFIWRLPIEMTNAIASKLGLPLISDSCHTTMLTNRSLNIPSSIHNDQDGILNRLDVSTLPKWVRKQMFEDRQQQQDKYSPSNSETKEFSKTLPRGRWAHRFMEENGNEMNPGLVKAYATNFEALASSRSQPTTPSGIGSPSFKDSLNRQQQQNNNRLSMINITSRDNPRTKSSMSSGVDEDDDNTTDSDNTNDSSYKVNKIITNDHHYRGSSRLLLEKNPNDHYSSSMVSSISMANIPYDDDDDDNQLSNEMNIKNQYNSLYISQENLEKIDQRNRYLKNVFENLDKNNINNDNNSDDSGINQIDNHSSLSSNSTLVNQQNQNSLSPPQPNIRHSLSSRSSTTSTNNKIIESPPSTTNDSKDCNETITDDATLSDITDINPDQRSSSSLSPEGLTATNNENDSTKFPILDTINEQQQQQSSSSSTLTNKENGDGGKNLSDSSKINNNSSSVTSATVDTITTISKDNAKSTPTTTSATTQQPTFISKKREELSKTLSEVKRRLQSVGSSTTPTSSSSLMTNSRSVINLRQSTLFSTTESDNQQQQQQQQYSHRNIRHRNRRIDLTSGDDDYDNDDDDDGQNNSYHSLSVDAFRKSISLSDLSHHSSCTLPRKLSIYRVNNQQTAQTSMNNYQFAPLWDQRRVGQSATNGTGSLSRTPSSNQLNKVDMMRSQSTLCRQPQQQQPGLWNNSAVNTNQSPASGTPVVNPSAVHLKPPPPATTPNGMINPRSGRSSAPPSQFRKSIATVSCASSSRRGDSTEDDEEMENDGGSAINSDDDNNSTSDERRILRPPRPVTPPKPNILKQIRRSSNSANVNGNGNPMMMMTAVASPNPSPYLNQQHPHQHYIQNPHQPIMSHHHHHHQRPRRLWSTMDTSMRSSKSEFNLANIGRDVPLSSSPLSSTMMRRRNHSGQMWPPPPSVVPNPALINNVDNRLDLYMTNPSSIPLSLDLCQHLVNEMNFLTNYASRIYERASYSDNQTTVVDYLKETLGQVSRDIQGIVGRSPTMNNKQAINANKQPDIVNIHNDKQGANGAQQNLDNPLSLNNNSQNNIENDPQTQQMFQQFMTFLKMTKNVNSGQLTPTAPTTTSSLINGQSSANHQQQQTSNKIITNNGNVNSD